MASSRLDDSEEDELERDSALLVDGSCVGAVDNTAVVDNDVDVPTATGAGATMEVGGKPKRGTKLVAVESKDDKVATADDDDPATDGAREADDGGVARAVPTASDASGTETRSEFAGSAAAAAAAVAAVVTAVVAVAAATAV